MDAEPPISWETYLVVIPVAAVLLAALMGVGVLISWLLGLGALAAIRMSRKPHPVSPDEEID